MKHQHLLICIAIGIVIATVIWLSLRKKSEDYKPTPTLFLTQQQTMDFLISDSDGFGKRLNKANLEANGVFNQQDLFDKWSSSARSWTPEEIEKLKRVAHIVDYIINSKLEDPFKAQMQSIKWQFAKTIHPYYLDGLPHTRADIIFLTEKTVATSEDQELARILLHEKSHLWSRKYEEEMRGWIEKNGFKAMVPVHKDPIQRHNPDINEWLYQDKQGRSLGVRYNSETPRDLSDTKGAYDKTLDHPYEQFAYNIEKLVKQ
jgi:hypothetical protein